MQLLLTHGADARHVRIVEALKHGQEGVGLARMLLDAGSLVDAEGVYLVS